MLTQAYAAHASGAGDKEGVVLARLAYRKLWHLHSDKSVACEVCMRDVLFYSEFTALQPTEREGWMQVNAKHVVQDFVSVTACVFSRPVEDEARMKHALQQAAAFIQAEKYPMQTFRPLIQALQIRELSPPASMVWWRGTFMALITWQQIPEAHG